MWLYIEDFMNLYNQRHPGDRRSRRTVNSWCPELAKRGLARKVPNVPQDMWQLCWCADTWDYNMSFPTGSVGKQTLGLLQEFRRTPRHISYREVAHYIGVPEQYISRFRHGDNRYARQILQGLWNAWEAGRGRIESVLAEVAATETGAGAVEDDEGPGGA